MVWLYYAGFENPVDGERAMAELLGEGIAPEDVSLVVPLDSSEENSYLTVDYMPPLAGVMPEIRQRPMTNQTARRLDDVSGIEELDDAASIAESMSEPTKDEWYGLQEEREALDFSETGWIRENLRKVRHRSPILASHPFITSILVRGQGIIIGDGRLATSILADQIGNHGHDLDASLKRCLWSIGLAPEASLRLTTCFAQGGAALTVAESALSIPIEAIESMIEELHPTCSGLFVDTETVSTQPHD